MEPRKLSTALQELPQRDVSKEQQRLLQLSPDLRQKTTLALQKYHDRQNFMTQLNPDAQIIAAQHKERAFFGDAPTLAVMRHAFGENFPVMWLMPQIFEICEFTGVKKIDEAQNLATARVIAQEYGYLKASELLLFFYRFKTGKYGRFYGTVDPMVIMTALSEFMREREAEIIRHEEEERVRAMEEHAKEAITAQEYCRRKGLPEMTMQELIASAMVKPPTD